MNELKKQSIETSIEATAVGKVYWDAGKRLDILTNVSFSVAPGEVVAILGPSGSGKTTLLNVLSGLDRPTEGRIQLGGVSLAALSDDEKASFRNQHLGFVFQFYHLLSELTALENVTLPALMKKNQGLNLEACQDRAQKLLERVGLGDRLGHFPSELSGGEKQRVAIARALMNEPKFLFCDEPTGNLDLKLRLEIIEILRDFFHQDKRTALLVTHDERVASAADRVLEMETLNPKGRIG